MQRLAISGLLKKSLITTNPIESALNIVRDRTCNVKNWKNGKMVQRWIDASFLEAETRFRRIKGYRDMALLRSEIRRLTVNKNDNQAERGEIRSKTA